jgi:hypothetical protein
MTQLSSRPPSGRRTKITAPVMALLANIAANSTSPYHNQLYMCGPRGRAVLARPHASRALASRAGRGGFTRAVRLYAGYLRGGGHLRRGCAGEPARVGRGLVQAEALVQAA